MSKTRAQPTGLEILGPEEAENWTRRLGGTAQPCGCKTGGGFALSAILGWPAWSLATGLPRTPVAVAIALTAYAGIVVSAAVAGKLIGIVVGRLHHRWLRRRLIQRLRVAAAARAGLEVRQGVPGFQ